MNPNISLKAKTVDDGYKTSNAVKWGASDRAVGEDVTSSSRQYSIERRNRVGRAGHGYGIERFHQSWGSSKERRVNSAASSWDDLTSTTEDRLFGKRDIGELELGVANS